jgi:hypothetical protein
MSPTSTAHWWPMEPRSALSASLSMLVSMRKRLGNRPVHGSRYLRSTVIESSPEIQQTLDNYARIRFLEPPRVWWRLWTSPGFVEPDNRIPSCYSPDLSFSNSIGVSICKALCRRWRLWNTSR